jgi:hypothetical protein
MGILSRKMALKAKCRTKAVIIKSHTETGIRYNAKNLKCNSWLCPKCARSLAHRWSNSVAEYFGNSRVFMLTVTIGGDCSVQDSYKNASNAWNILRGKIVRKYGRFKYVRVLEVQPKTQRAHYHILCDTMLDKIWLNSAVVESGFGKINDFTECRKNEIKSYVSKYLRKEIPAGHGSECMYECNARRVSGGKGFFLHKFALGFGKTCLRNLQFQKVARVVSEIFYHATASGWITTLESGFDNDYRIFLEPVDDPLSDKSINDEKMLDIFIDELNFSLAD